MILRFSTYLFDTLMYCKMITTTGLITPATGHIIAFSFLWREGSRSTLSNYEMSYMLLLMIITMLYMRPSELTHLVTGTFYSLTNIVQLSKL